MKKPLAKVLQRIALLAVSIIYSMGLFTATMSYAFARTIRDPARPSAPIIINAGPYKPGDIIVETQAMYRSFLKMTPEGYYLVQDFYKGNIHTPQTPQYYSNRPNLPFERCDAWKAGSDAASFEIDFDEFDATTSERLYPIHPKTDPKRTDPYVLLDESSLTLTQNLESQQFDALRLSTSNIGLRIQGSYVQWYPEGGKWTQGEFDAGVKTATWQEWNPLGHLITRGEYEAGLRKGIWVQWSMDNHKCQEGAYMERVEAGKTGSDLRQGLWQRWHDNGQLAAQHTFEQGVLQGEGLIWYANGQLDVQGQYVDNKAEGGFISWYENGNKMIESTYHDGERNGPFRFWYENGQLYEQGQYLNGERHGAWVYWHRNGQKEKQGEYNKGRIVWRWLVWDSNGQSLPAENYGRKGVAVSRY